MKEIVYPFFIECCQHTDDRFWKNVFDDLAYGITPYGTYIVKDFLTCKYKDKDFSYKIQKKDSKILFEEVYNLLKNKLGLISLDEIVKKKTDIKTEDIKNDWSLIKKKNIKDLLIERYVIEMKKRHSLTLQQTRYLMSIIFIGFVFKVLTPADIEYVDGKILDIQGIEFEEGKINLTRDFYDITINPTPEIVIDKGLMSSKWGDYLKKIDYSE